jgi:CSLREA domain-containing protein
MRTLVLVFSLLGIVVPTRHAAAVTFAVDSSVDASDAAPGDGACATVEGGCTLRAAVEEANALPGGAHVDLPAATYRLTTHATLEVTGVLGISCPDGVATIDAQGYVRVLHFGPDANANLHDVVIRGGNGINDALGGGAILNEGLVVLGDTTIVGNGGFVAAGIRNTASGFLRLFRSVVRFNSYGPAILNEGEFVADWSTIAQNDDVAIENHGRTTLLQTTVDHNTGGGIVSSGTDAHVRTVRSALVRNGKRGALDLGSGSAVLQQSTISGNLGAQATAVLASGGGTLELDNVTVAGNGRSSSPTAALDGDGTVGVSARNTIIAGNAGSAGDPDCRLTVTSLGTNLMSCPLASPDPTTIVGDPLLAPLTEWRFPYPDFADVHTWVHPLLPGSPAIDAGTCVLGDQSGVPRPQGAQCDIGASEAPTLCAGGVGIGNARVRVRQHGAWSMVTVSGALAFADTATPVLDPLSNGAQLRIERVGADAGAFLERTESSKPLTGARGLDNCDGWHADATASRFAWHSSAAGNGLCVTGHVGILKVRLEDQRPKARGIVLKAETKMPRVAVGTTLRLTIVLGGDPLGFSTAGANGACAVQDVVCTSADANGTRFDCR